MRSPRGPARRRGRHALALAGLPRSEPLAPELWDDEAWHELATRAVGLARDAGALTVLPIALDYRAGVHVHAGEFAAASALIEEADAITRGDRQHTRCATRRSLLAAWRGREAEALDAHRRPASGTRPREARDARSVWPDYATAVLYNGLGRYDEALAAARRACEHDDLGFYGWSLAELVEAAARSGEREVAADALRRLEERTRRRGTDWALGIEARSRALLADDDRAEALYREAIEQLGRTRMVVHLARAHLLYGEWLRRENRRVDAREQLRTAYETLGRMGAGGVRRARPARAAGHRRDGARTQRGGARRSSRPQEAQIARLARGRAHEPRDRCAAVHQPADRRVPPAQGVHEARHQLPQGASRRAGHRYSRSFPAVETSRMSAAISSGIGGICSRSRRPGPDQTRLTCSAGSRSG